MAEAYGAPPLPVRRSRTVRPGRHSSPYQLSLPDQVPALILAVPGAASTDSDQVTAEIAATASACCPGAGVAVGYLEGNQSTLGQVLSELTSADGRPPAVVVPLLTSPYPEIDAAIAAAVAGAGVPVLTADHLGPHPSLAEAMHDRLSEAGLARAGRAGRLSIVTAADGVIVGAVGGGEASQAAGIVAVLLASRLAVPIVPAPLDDHAAVAHAVQRLYAAQVTRAVLAPCVIGPELTAGALATVAAQTGLECAPPLGSHPAIGQLVAIRYGAALQDPKLADVSP